ncbi:MAG: ABC transporter permease [Gammaproteobacteria bacterium]
MKLLFNVIRKEWRDATRDRRSITSSLLFAVLGPLLIFFLLDSLADDVDSTDALPVAVVGAQYAPTMIAKLAEQGIAWTRYESLEAARSAAPEVLVTIPDDFSDRYLDGVPVDVAITANFKNSKDQAAALRVEKIMSGYGNKISYSRLIAAGVAPDSVRAIKVTTYDSSLAGGRASRISDSMIYMFLLAAFVSGALMAADSIAGERERHSLESLLSQPVSPLTLTAGKWIAAAMISGIVSTATVAIGGLVLAVAPLEVLGLRIVVSPLSILMGVLVLLPLALMAVAMQMFFAARARTYREAGIYAQFTSFLPIVVAGTVMIGNVDYGTLGQLLPITSQTMALKDVLLEGRPAFRAFFGGSLTTLLAAAAFVWFTSKRLSDERSL